MPKFSVIVPIYNVEKYLPRCIDSLVNQTLKDIEIILVDDGSPDNCPVICDEYAAKDDRIKVIHKKNGGVSAARNDGLYFATGEYVIFCDSDDWMELDACEVMYETALQNDVDVVVGDIYRIKGHEAIYNRYFAEEFTYRDRSDMDKLVEADIYQNYCHLPPTTPTIGYGGPWNKAVRRTFLLEHGIQFDVSLLGLYDDILYTAYVYANTKSVTYVQKPVYNYVVVETSITNSYKSNSVDISRRIFEAFESFISNNCSEGKWNKAYYALVIRRLEETLRLYFFSLKNKKKKHEMLSELNKLLNSEPYITACQGVELEKLMSHHRKVAVLAKRRSAFGLYLLYTAKIILKKI